MSTKTQQLANRNRQAFLLTFFSGEQDYETKEVNGFVLEKHINGNTFEHEVAIYSKEAWERRKTYLSAPRSLF